MLHVLGSIIAYGIAVLVLALMAKRKNRDPWAWGFIGAFFCLPTLVILAFMSYLCPKCKNPISDDEWRQKECPRCSGTRPGKKDSECKEFLECPSCKTMIPPGEPKCPRCGWS